MDRREAIKRTGFLFGGAAFSAISLSSLASCQSASTPAWQPTYLSVDQGQIIRSIADILIPTTDTPGALDASVPEFLDEYMKDCMDETEQKQIQDGFAGFMAQCKEVMGKDFNDCSKEEQLKFLQQVEKEAKDSDAPSFIEGAKQMVYWGFFTSEQGGEMLGFESIPGEYIGCMPLSEATDVSGPSY